MCPTNTRIWAPDGRAAGDVFRLPRASSPLGPQQRNRSIGGLPPPDGANETTWCGGLCANPGDILEFFLSLVLDIFKLDSLES